MSGWEERAHTADIAIHVWGDSLADLFVQAAKGMFGVMASEGDSVRTEITVVLEAEDEVALLVDWLNELLYLSEREQMIFCDVTLEEMAPTRLRAKVRGCSIEEIDEHIKAATYHMLSITPTNGGYEAEIVFDV